MEKDFLFKYIDAPYSEEEIGVVYEMYKHLPPSFRMVELEKTLAQVPTITEWFKKVGLTPTHVALISVRQWYTQVPHVDYNHYSQASPYLAINYPVWACEGVKTKFYKLLEPPKLEHTPKTGLPYYHCNVGKPIAEFVLTSPVLLNVLQPHSVDNINNPDQRISLSFRFAEDPWFMV